MERIRKMGASVALATSVGLMASNFPEELNGCSGTNKVQVPEYSNPDVFVAGAPYKEPLEKKTYDRSTYFGCDPALGYQDDQDACDARLEKQIAVCNVPGEKPLRGARCQEEVVFFTANATEWLSKDEYNGKGTLHTKVKVTNIKNGKSVVAMPIDWGPGCQVQGKQSKFDLSYRAYTSIKSSDGKNFGVRVERVPDNTPLGSVSVKK